MKLKKRREIEFSPDSLIVPECSKPIPKRKKLISAISFMILVACSVFARANVTDSLIVGAVVYLFALISFVLAITTPIEFVVNKLLQIMYNQGAREEMIDEEESYKDEEFFDDNDDFDEEDDILLMCEEDDEDFDYGYEQYLEDYMI